MTVKIRKIHVDDYEQVDQVIKDAYTASDNGYSGEAELTNAIRKDRSHQHGLELVAVDDDKIVGHVLLSRAVLHDSEGKELIGEALIPLSVLPDYQGQNIGKKLVFAIEKEAREYFVPFISVVGDPDFYTQLGYQSAESFAVETSNGIPQERLLLKEITSYGLRDSEGEIKYLNAFRLLDN